MRNKYDDLLNKFVDGELSTPEIEEVNHLIDSNKEFKTSLSTHKYVHDTLFEIPLKSAPRHISELVMKKIVTPLSEKYRKNYFFRGILGVMSLIFMTVLFMFFFYASDLTIVKEASSIPSSFLEYLNPIMHGIYNIISSEIFQTVSGLVGFIILLGFYFHYNSFRQLKEKLNQL